MHDLQALILGIVQGLTEFIPVSSSGHLILVGHLLNFQDSGLAFDVALNIGTLGALLIFFRRDFMELFVSLFKRNERTRQAILLLIASIPAVIVGVLLEKEVKTVFRSDNLVAINLIAVAFVMLWADRWAANRAKLEQMTSKHALGIGLAQAVAVVPGVSRSGITISAGLFEGYERVAATRFSFLLSAPIIAGATAKVLLEHSSWAEIAADKHLFIFGITGALVSGYLAIKFLLNYLAHHGLKVFAYYRIGVGVLILLVGIFK